MITGLKNNHVGQEPVADGQQAASFVEVELQAAPDSLVELQKEMAFELVLELLDNWFGELQTVVDLVAFDVDSPRLQEYEVDSLAAIDGNFQELKLHYAIGIHRRTKHTQSRKMSR